MKNMVYFLMILELLFLFGCTPSDSATNLKKGESSIETFTPPADGKITEEQVNRYIATASEMSSELSIISEKIKALKVKYGIKDDVDMEDMSKLGPGAKEEYDAIIKNWEVKEKEIYSKNKMTPSEFEWIAAGLTEPQNTEIQKRVEKALSGE